MAYAGWRIREEATTEIELGDLWGEPCGRSSLMGQEMADTNRTISVSAIGMRSSLSKAIRKADTNCADLGKKIDELIFRLAQSVGDTKAHAGLDEILAKFPTLKPK